jgi:CheY-like chemotaxis protein
MSPTIRILLIEDDPDDQLLMRESLAGLGGDGESYALTVTDSLDDARRRLSEQSFDLILSDLTLPGSQGLDTVKTVVQASPDVPVVVITGLRNESMAVEALRLGAQDYLEKGSLQAPILRRTLRHARERFRILRELHHTTVSRDYVDMILDRMVEMLVVVDEGGRIQKINPATASSARRG